MAKLQRVTVTTLTLLTLLANAPDVTAGGRRARLSEDLVRRLSVGDVSATDRKSVV